MTIATPRVQLRVEANGVYRAIFENPNDEIERVTQAVANVLRVYYATHPSLTYTELEDIELPFVAGNQPITLTFSPNSPGSFVFTWVLQDDEGADLDESAKSFEAEYVYGRPDVLARTLNLTQGCFLSQLTMAQLMEVNSYASRMFDEYTGWHFYPKYHTFTTQGEDSYDLEVQLPIIQVNEIWMRSRDTSDWLVDPYLYVVYNRHMRDRMMYNPSYPTRPDGFLVPPGDGSGEVRLPDDRQNPKISFTFPNEYGAVGQPGWRGGIYPNRQIGLQDHLGFNHGFRTAGFRRGRQDLIIKGVFGYTEADMRVPVGVTMATERLALRQATLVYGDNDQIFTVLNSHRITAEKTDGHSIQFDNGGASGMSLVGAYTGDQYIDLQIAMYGRNSGGGFV